MLVSRRVLLFCPYKGSPYVQFSKCHSYQQKNCPSCHRSCVKSLSCSQQLKIHDERIIDWMKKPTRMLAASPHQDDMTFSVGNRYKPLGTSLESWMDPNHRKKLPKTNIAMEKSTNWKCISYPIGSMYGIFSYIWLFLMVNYGKCR